MLTETSSTARDITVKCKRNVNVMTCKMRYRSVSRGAQSFIKTVMRISVLVSRNKSDVYENENFIIVAPIY